MIDKKIGLDKLPEKLAILAKFRLQNPELTLKEVADKVPDGPISKSGINHRFQKIKKIAQNLGEKHE